MVYVILVDITTKTNKFYVVFDPLSSSAHRPFTYAWSTSVTITFSLYNPICDEFRLSGLGFDLDIDDAFNYDDEESNDDYSGTRRNTSAGSSGTLVFKSVPQTTTDSLADMETKILQELATHDGSVERAAADVSGRLEVRNGRALTIAHIRQMFSLDNGHTCPHGGPIFHQLRTADLARLFGWSWWPKRKAHLVDTTEAGTRRRAAEHYH